VGESSLKEFARHGILEAEEQQGHSNGVLERGLEAHNVGCSSILGSEKFG